MLRRRKFEALLLLVFFLFSLWLMHKSFGYDVKAHKFRVARHQVGDFGLHLSLIRSFSWGDNIPSELPFYPGKPLSYHYYFDAAVGLLERYGVRVDFVLNGLSAIFFTALLFSLYKLPQVIFGGNKILGTLSVILFVFHSNLTFVDFIKGKPASLSLFHDLWLLPDYLNKGPFDNSTISLFFTLNVFLNQRHFILALAISLILLYFVLQRLVKRTKIPNVHLILAGSVLGLVSRVHTLTFFSTALILFLLLSLFKRFNAILPLFIPALAIFSPHLRDIATVDLSHPIINPGFLSQKPFHLESFLSFWFFNLGFALFLIPLGFFFSNKGAKKFFLSIFSLFVLGNVFQFSFRIDHNHSLFNYFLALGNFYVAFLLVKLWEKQLVGKVVVSVLFFLLTISGVIDLMVIKNDYQYTFTDAPSNVLMQWIKNNTEKNAVFVGRQEILDPITLSGRKNYLGHSYYLSVMGYNSSERERFVRSVFEASDATALLNARGRGIDYLTVPKKKISDFNYRVDFDFLRSTLQRVYEDDEVVIFKI